MKRGLLAGLVTGSFLFFTIGLANAIPITQEFYIEIDSIKASPHPLNEEYFNEQEARGYYPTAGVGSKFYGSVTYNDANISKSGHYVIGYPAGYGTDPLANEIQDWVLVWSGIGLGWMFDTQSTAYPRLYFRDKKLSGIDVIYHADLEGWLENEGFQKAEYLSVIAAT